MKVTVPRIISSARLCAITPFALIARLFSKNIWLISERPTQARDNGYVFYKYMRDKHPEQKVFYLIDKHSKDFLKVEQIGKTIQFNSWQHFFYFVLSKIHISAHVGGCAPTAAVATRWLKKPLGYKDIFIPHGVNVQIAEFCFKKYSDIDLYISCSPFERQNMIDNHGYESKEVPLTGFPRQDGWWNYTVDPKLIIMMPTWRVYLAHEHCDDFRGTDYFKAFHSLVNDQKFIEFLSANDIKLIFYPHNEMRKFMSYFSSDCENVEIAVDDSKYDIQDLLKRGALLITDYSSLYFDFAYMCKPVVYYQFDREEFNKLHYKQCGFDVEKYGFGPVCTDKDQVIQAVIDSYGAGFSMTQMSAKARLPLGKRIRRELQRKKLEQG